jgi:hypothetical protein
VRLIVVSRSVLLVEECTSFERYAV